MAPNPTAYYNDFWLYVSYYGEAAARAYYTQWAPPEGSLPPAGTPLPAAPLPHEHVPEPVGEVQNYKNENNNPSVRVAEATPPIDPAIAAAYEEFKIEVRHFTFPVPVISMTSSNSYGIVPSLPLSHQRSTRSGTMNTAKLVGPVPTLLPPNRWGGGYRGEYRRISRGMNVLRPSTVGIFISYQTCRLLYMRRLNKQGSTQCV